MSDQKKPPFFRPVDPFGDSREPQRPSTIPGEIPEDHEVMPGLHESEDVRPTSGPDIGEASDRHADVVRDEEFSPDPDSPAKADAGFLDRAFQKLGKAATKKVSTPNLPTEGETAPNAAGSGALAEDVPSVADLDVTEPEPTSNIGTAGANDPVDEANHTDAPVSNGGSSDDLSTNPAGEEVDTGLSEALGAEVKTYLADEDTSAGPGGKEVSGIISAPMPPDGIPFVDHNPNPASYREPVLMDHQLCHVWNHHFRDLSRITDGAIKELMDSIVWKGVCVPVLARRRRDGTIEIISGALRWEAVRRLALLGTTIDLLVEFVDVDDAGAFELLFRQNERLMPLCALERGRYYDTAIKTVYGNGKACADAFGVHKSSVSRALDVLRAVDIVGRKVDDVRHISMAQATWLMKGIRQSDKEADPTDPGQPADSRDETMAAIEQVQHGSAAAVFKQLRAQLTPATTKDEIEVVIDDDVIVGSMRVQRRTGAVRIDLLPHAGGTEIPSLIKAIRVAMGKLRAA